MRLNEYGQTQYKKMEDLDVSDNTYSAVRIDCLKAQIDLVHFLLDYLGVVGARTDRTAVTRQNVFLL